MGHVIHTAGKRGVNTRWFKDQLEDRQISQRKLAKAIGIDPSAVSLMLRGLREIKVEEAIQLAQILGLPKDDVLANLGVDLSQDDRTGERVAVAGYITEGGRVIEGPAMGPKTVPMPPDVPPGTVALRDQSGTTWDGWVTYYKPVDYVMPEAIGRFSVVEVMGSGEKFVKVLRHGFEPGTYRLIGVNGTASDVGRIRSASPVIWVRQ